MTYKSRALAGFVAKTFGALMFVTATSGVATAEWLAVANYDATSNSNTVDVSATATGTGQEIGLADFTTLVAAAHASGNGGVIDFETHTGTAAETIDGDNLYTSFDGGNKSITIGGTANGFATSIPFVGAGRTAISGTGMLGNNAFTGGADLAFGPIVGGQTNEYVTACGLTVLSRDASTLGYTDSNYTMTAYFSDGTTASQVSTIQPVNGIDDTFYGFVAPTGSHITELKVRLTSGTYHAALDDLGFVTSVVVPEPGSVISLLMAAVCGAVVFWRRSRC